MKPRTKQIIAATLAIVLGGGILLGSVSIIISNFMH